VGCVVSEFRYQCPHPEWCVSLNTSTLPCINCNTVPWSPLCPNATLCLGPGERAIVPTPPMPVIECIDCMSGMPMPHCQFPALCPVTSECPMSMYFGASNDTCLLLEQWKVGTVGQWIGAIIGILLLALIREFISIYRIHRVGARKQQNLLRKLYITLCNNNSTNISFSSTSTNLRPNHLSDKEPVALQRSPLISDVGGSAGSVIVTSGNGNNNKGNNNENINLRQHLLNHNIIEDSKDSNNEFFLPMESDFSIHFYESIYYFFSLLFGYLLMLIIMTYNIYLCLTVIIECGLMHFICNFYYYSIYKKKYLFRIRQLVADLNSNYGNNNKNISIKDSMIKAPANALLVDSSPSTQPANGDHCCDDMMFEDD
jgi:hypothetical protein